MKAHVQYILNDKETYKHSTDGCVEHLVQQTAIFHTPRILSYTLLNKGKRTQQLIWLYGAMGEDRFQHKSVQTGSGVCPNIDDNRDTNAK